MEINDIKKEIKNLKKLTAEQVIESEKLKKSVIDAVNCFIRLETLYKIKCKELELVKEKARKETAEKILKDLWAEFEKPAFWADNVAEIIKELAKQFGVDLGE